MVLEKILAHLDSKDPSTATARLPRSRAPEQLVRLIHLVPLRGCESQRRGAVTVVPMAGELATCADVWEFSRPAPDPPGPMTA